MKAARDLSIDELIGQLAQMDSEVAKRFLAGRRNLFQPEVVLQLNQAAHDRLRVDVGEAMALAEAALHIAEQLDNQEILAVSLRAKANALHFQGDYRASVEYHGRSLALFEELGLTEQIGRSLSASIQPMALLGQYDGAYEAAERAREIFSRTGGDRRLARLENNLGNIFHRQERFAEAAACYERAYQQLVPFNDYEGMAVSLHNLAVCLIGLNDFHRALESYHQARELGERHGLPLLKAQADYNIAWLHYQRGNYSLALELLRGTRELCRVHGDAYHAALCDLDQSEIYLELNLIQEAAEMAQIGFQQFQQMGVGYESAKTLTNLAIALGRQKQAFRALELFGQAREMLAREKNLVWPSLIDLYQALFLLNEGRLFEARRLCLAALSFFENSFLPGKAVLCHLLLARLALRTRETSTAEKECTQALEMLSRMEAPVLAHQANFLLGQVYEAEGRPQEASHAYQTARQVMEALRSSLHGEELKIAFMQNKLEVYERLVELALRREPRNEAVEEAFGYIEEAKSRALLDLITGRARPGPRVEHAQSELVRRIGNLREELNWYYHRIETEQLGREELSGSRLEELQRLARAREAELQRVLREMPQSTQEEQNLYVSPAATLEEIREALDPQDTLLEYYKVGDRVLAAVLTRQTLEIFPLTLASRVDHLLRLLQFQVSKFRLGAEYTSTFESTLLANTQAHLQKLYEELFRPLRARLAGDHLILVPHEQLHYLPFQALHDGKQYLAETFTMTYAPSAAIYAHCRRKSANSSGHALVLGIPDPLAPFILDEVKSVAAIFPNPELFIGEQATFDVLREKGPGSKFVHIATHGRFRQDNPMFSGVRLGDSYLSLYDLYELRLPAELIALSGCSTGMNVIAAGDELLGLVRGLLYAGARSLLLTLWDVHDKSAAEFMTGFYRRFQNQESKAKALQNAMLELRESRPHPYYWAPFTLVGAST